MDEVISKRMAIETFKDCAVNGVGIDGIVDALKQLPPIQPEIVRCKDCKFWSKHTGEQIGCCDVLKRCTREYFYCGTADMRGEQ